MEGQFKKIFSIGGAILLGVIIIFFAWKSGSLGTIPLSSEKNLSQDTPTLSIASSKPNTQRTLGVWRSQEGPRDLSTSTTDMIAYELITNYARVQKTPGASLTDAEIEAQAQALVKKITPSAGPRYTLANLIVSGDTSMAARTTYLVAITKLSQEFIASQATGDFLIIFEDPKKMDIATKRIEIAKNIAHYEILKRGLLATKVPSDIATLHLSLVQTYSNMQNSLSSLVEIYNDPMRGLAGFTEYRAAVQDITILTNEFGLLALKK